MKRFSLLVIAACLVVAGCSSNDQGSDTTVKTNSDGSTNVTVTNPDGSKTNVSTDKSGSMKIDGPNGSASMGAGTSVTEAEIGVPFYPGSTEKAGASFKMETEKEKAYSSVRTTTDDPTKVADFYKDKVKGATSTTTSSGDTTMAMTSGKLENGAKFAMTAVRKNGETETLITIGIGSR